MTPALSILLLARDTLASTARCLASLLETVPVLGLDRAAVEYVLIDDHSDTPDIVRLFREVRAAVAPADVRIVRFTAHRHYVYGVAMGLSLARGQNVLLVSHDMIVPPACVRQLLAVAASDPAIGVVRPVSPHMDMAHAQQVAIPPGVVMRNSADVAAFARFVARYHGLDVAAPPLFVGDAFLVTRATLDRIGVFDTRFYGFMGDIDFGVRARRSGVRVVTASGAWLYHDGRRPAQARRAVRGRGGGGGTGAADPIRRGGGVGTVPVQVGPVAAGERQGALRRAGDSVAP
jgi:GT2 family glycosyltransferase